MPSPDAVDIEFFLDHLQNNSTLVYPQNKIATYRPLNLEYSYVLSEIGDLSCSFGLYQENIFGGPIAPDIYGQDQFAPKRTDYYLWASIDGGATKVDIHSGICQSVALKANEGLVHFSGQDWLCFLDQPWPFGGYAKANPSTWTVPDDILKYWINQTQQTIINDILSGAGALWGTSGYTLSANYNGAGWTQVVDKYIIEIGDTTSVLEHIKTIGKWSDPYGFDFISGADTGKQVNFWSPRKTVDANVTAIAKITPSGNCWIDCDWNNTGPIATRTIGMPSGFPGMRGYSTYPGSVQTFRDWYELVQLGDNIRTQNTTDRATIAIGTFHRFPQKHLTVTIRPEYLIANDPIAGFQNQCGNSIEVDSESKFLPYHRINAKFWITGQRFRFDDKGNATCELTLDQIYSLAGVG